MIIGTLMKTKYLFNCCAWAHRFAIAQPGFSKEIKNRFFSPMKLKSLLALLLLSSAPFVRAEIQDPRYRFISQAYTTLYGNPSGNYVNAYTNSIPASGQGLASGFTTWADSGRSSGITFIGGRTLTASGTVSTRAEISPLRIWGDARCDGCSFLASPGTSSGPPGALWHGGGSLFYSFRLNSPHGYALAGGVSVVNPSVGFLGGTIFLSGGNSNIDHRVRLGVPGRIESISGTLAPGEYTIQCNAQNSGGSGSVHAWIDLQLSETNLPPGSSADNPILPFPGGGSAGPMSPGWIRLTPTNCPTTNCLTNAFVFIEAPGGRWFDPPLTEEFHFATLDGSAFKAIDSLPVGIDADNLFTVSVGSTNLGQFAGGQKVNFVALTGSGVGEFKIAGINPKVDAGDETAFPVKLSFLTETADFVMSPEALPEAPLPPPWVYVDVGNPDLAGTTAFTNGVFAVTGAGNDIWGFADSLQFAYQRLSGDCEITAQVASLQPTDQWAKAGVMIRESLDAGSANAFVGLSRSNGVAFQIRLLTNAPSYSATGPGISAPGWVKLKRLGSRVTGYFSTNGVTWSEIAATDVPMKRDIHVGLAVTSHNTDALNTAEFESVSVKLLNVFQTDVSTTMVFETFDTSATPAGGAVPGWIYGSGVSGISRTFTDGVGVFGSRASKLTASFSDSISGAAIQIAGTEILALKSTNLGDYRLQFDLKATVPNANVDFFIQTWPNKNFGGTMTGTRSGPLQLSVPANTFQTVTLNLGDTNFTGAFDPRGRTWQLAWQINSGQWGVDGGSYALTIDNVILTHAPKVIEPFRLELISFNSLGQPQFLFAGQAEVNYALESSSNLVNWVTTTNFSTTNATQLFVLPLSNVGPAQFFRASRQVPP